MRSRAVVASVRRFPRKAAGALLAAVALTMLPVAAGVVDAGAQPTLPQQNSLQQDAYWALQAGINAYLTALNANPDVARCSASSTESFCAPYVFGAPVTVSQTPDGVPESYEWQNPTYCDTSCSNVSPTDSITPFATLDVTIQGTAGTSGDSASQSADEVLMEQGGFLNDVLWTNYNITDPALNGDPTTDCTYDWNNDYNGPNTTSTDACSPIYFSTSDTLIGPVYSNDSIYVSPSPSFGVSAGDPAPVTTADPYCLFVGAIDYPSASASPAEWEPPGCDVQTAGYPCADNSNTGPQPAVAQQVNFYDPVDSDCGAPVESMPATDNSLSAEAAQDGCLYTGPTTISFYEAQDTGRMLVWSPDTPATQASGLECGGGSVSATPNVPVPDGSNGNGVIYVQNVTNTSCPGTIGTVVGTADSCEAGTDCPAGINPYDDLYPAIATGTDGSVAPTGDNYGTQAQIAYGEYNFTNDLYQNESPNYADCEGDVFVRNTNLGEITKPSLPWGHAATPGLAGNLTVAAANNVVVTGNLTYADCSLDNAYFNSTIAQGCPSSASGRNDSLGLIANGDVEVNQPLNTCTEWNSGATTCEQYATEDTTANNLNVAPSCASGSQPFVANGAEETDQLAALCDPSVPAGTYPGQGQGPGAGVTIDAAIVALRHSFGVNNFYDDNQEPLDVGGAEGNLFVYGSIAENYRGPVGTFCDASPAADCPAGSDGQQSGYTKYYTWDSRLPTVQPPGFSPTSADAFSLDTPLTLTKSTTATGYDAVGQTIPYSYQLQNTGSATLTDVAVSDDLVPSVSCPSGTLAPGQTETCTGGYTVTQTNLSSPAITNLAVATAVSGTSSEEVSSAPAEVTVDDENEALTLVKSTTATSYDAAGQTVPYAYQVTNTGSVTLAGVAVTDNKIPNVSCPSSSLSPGSSETCTGSYAVTQEDIDAGSLTNTAVASATSPAPVSSAPSMVTIPATVTPAITVTQSTTSTGYDAPGQPVPLSFTVANTGNTTLSDVSVSDDLVPDVSCPPGSLAVGTSTTCSGTYDVTLNDILAGSITSTAAASATDALGQTVTASAPSLAVPLTFTAGISVTQSTTSTSYDAPGQSVPLSFAVTNTGDSPLSGISVSDDLVPDVSCPSGSLAVGATVTCSGTYDVTLNDILAGSITSTAAASATDELNQVVTSSPSSVTVSVLRCDPATFTSATSATATDGSPFAFTVIACSTSVPTLTTGKLPTGLTFVDNHNGTATLSGTPRVTGGADNLTIEARVNGQPTVTQTFTLEIDQAPSITSKDSATATAGTAFSVVTTAEGYPAPTLTASSSPALPSDLSFTDNGNGTATLSGTPGPEDGGVYTLTIQADNAVGTSAPQRFTLTIDAAPIITSPDSDTVAAGATMAAFHVTATGYPAPAFRGSGALPVGVRFSKGVLSGKPGATAAGTYQVTIQATNKAGSTEQTFTLTVT